MQRALHIFIGKDISDFRTLMDDSQDNQTNSTFVINAPTGWSFNTGVTQVFLFTAGRDISAISIAVTSTSVITITYTTPSAADNALDRNNYRCYYRHTDTCK
jgi:hypothetical protein